MKRTRAILASTLLAVTAVPAMAAAVVDITVDEHFNNGHGYYVLHNNSDPGISVYGLLVTNPFPTSADANRSDWSAGTFYNVGSALGFISVVFDCQTAGTAAFGPSSGFCYNDNGLTDPLNPIDSGESQKFKFTSFAPASLFVAGYIDATGAPTDFRGETTFAGAVPEPATLGIFGGAFALFGWMRRWRKDRA
jgi:PEP-CTERM motif